ncbi:oxidoreductase [Phyllobacterium brassicacearum]|uniref:Oxidoreductase n=1 Tax=Phyllobacterium brassicacearum TaxID=314235 RepID=A0A2P7BWP0_9HYPH|nr:SDR family oxidoreductase [Phyllobacterium brassicacearum]PSH70866.1 oxidoreductase [Phyllobacterium brassicacearum]TDQ35639.1 NADP-dependent 3-hydroxy acid dehydrogenase YdfG [Phyllobacterium brassicacearum]
MSIKGKVALVTGASSGIGAATALKLAANGATVGLAARRIDRLSNLQAKIEAGGGTAIAIEMDVVDAASVTAGVEKLASAFGSIDIVFNNAGLMPISDMEALKTDEWHRMVDVNVKGLLNTVAAVLPHMVRQKSGHMVNTSSIAGRKVFPGLAVYCATKHAVTALSEGMRLELSKKHNIKITCVQPGAVETELFEHISDGDYRQQMEALKDQMEFLKPEDIADTILYALQAPDRVDIAEVFVMPTQQPW